jgi:hypothetical protein
LAKARKQESKMNAMIKISNVRKGFWVVEINDTIAYTGPTKADCEEVADCLMYEMLEEAEELGVLGYNV